MLLFFTATTMFSLVKFHSYRDQAFTPWWWIWCATTGISIGAVTSVKWVGFLGMAVVGLYTVEDLWNKFGDLNMPVVRRPRSRMLILAHLCTSLGSTNSLFHRPSPPRLHGLLLDPLPHPRKLRSRRRTNVLPLPSQSQRLRSPQLPPRNRIRIQSHYQKRRVRGWPASLARSTLPGGESTTTSDVLPSQRRQ